jgi:hypothetical protein
MMPDSLDRPFDRRIIDELARPDLLLQLLLRNDAVVMRQQIRQDQEDFGPQPDGLPGTMESMALGVEDAIAEDVYQWVRPPWARRQAASSCGSSSAPRASA